MTGSALPRALVVDPDPDTRLFYKTALEPFTAGISEAEDGAEALGRALCNQPALIVTETTLPRVDGFELCVLLRRDPLTARAGIVVVTGAASPSVTSRAVAAGADAVLAKPCGRDELLATVYHVCRRTR